MHKYLCTDCNRYVWADSVTDLAHGVNRHNQNFHPTRFAKYDAALIASSPQYTAMTAGSPIPAYLEPYGTTSKYAWGSAQHAPNITDEDRAMLARGLVKWD